MAGLTGWVAEVTRPAQVPDGVLAVDGDEVCDAVAYLDGYTWECGRPPHRARHMASPVAPYVLAAWPGEHPPTEADWANGQPRPDLEELVRDAVEHDAARGHTTGSDR